MLQCLLNRFLKLVTTYLMKKNILKYRHKGKFAQYKNFKCHIKQEFLEYHGKF